MAREIIEKEKIRDPGNAAIALLENDIDFLSAYISEEQFYYKRLLSNKDKRLSVIGSGNAQSPYCLYALADIHLQCAFVKLKFGDYVSGARDFLKANSLLKKNQKLFPKFILNLKGLGVLHAMAGVVPSEFKWLSAITGLVGTIEQGLGELDSLFLQTNSTELYFVKPEVALMLFYLKNNFENVRGEKMIPQLFTDSTLLQNPLIAFGYSGFLMKTGRAEEAIRILEEVDKPGDIPFLLLEYRLGFAKLCRGDKEAVSHLLKFAASFKGKNYLRSSFRYIAWHYLLSGDEKKYKQFIADVLFVGSAVIDEDKDATREANEKRIPDKSLLRARLFYDGGFFSNASAELKSGVSMKSKIDSVEYDYRLARIVHALADTTQAIILYVKTFSEGKFLRNHFASNSALMLGMIYERRNEKAKAREWYYKCINLPQHDYQASIGRKAKAGLVRVK
ncbi:MAG TPA: hypothetical protein VI757_15070 [Bacteroidia bacterium]|nr:hypothetical protein [Bacteroidia bacterium]